jgi:hypothetical protein
MQAKSEPFDLHDFDQASEAVAEHSRRIMRALMALRQLELQKYRCGPIKEVRS